MRDLIAKIGKYSLVKNFFLDIFEKWVVQVIQIEKVLELLKEKDLRRRIKIV